MNPLPAKGLLQPYYFYALSSFLQYLLFISFYIGSID